MKVTVKHRSDVESVTLVMNEREAGILKLCLENLCFKHKNELPMDLEQTIYYPLKRAMKGIISCENDIHICGCCGHRIGKED